MPKPFASSADLAEKEATLETLADGVYAYTAQGDPNVGCIVGTDAILAIEARATPLMAGQWIDVIRRDISQLPFERLNSSLDFRLFVLRLHLGHSHKEKCSEDDHGHKLRLQACHTVSTSIYRRRSNTGVHDEV